MTRVCRVQPDVGAVARSFDYTVPAELAAGVTVGTVVRVPLHGRRVRGWVVADAVVPEAPPDRLQPITALRSAGPPADVVALCQWAAWRYAGPVVALLRAASPPIDVDPRRRVEPGAAVYPLGPAPTAIAEARTRPWAVLAWPPATDRREVLVGLLAAEGSTIVVVPSQERVAVAARALEREGRSVVVLTSDAPDRERAEAWDEARTGACVVVGGRTAVFAPVPDLAAIVVLDEDDEAQKEERAPAWHAREIAVERARRTGARLTLIAATPTVDAVEAAGAPLRPDRRTERAGWPRFEIVDLRDEPPGRHVLSGPLATALRQTVDDGTRAVCVLNLRGGARLLSCAQCGELARCEACASAVVGASASERGSAAKRAQRAELARERAPAGRVSRPAASDRETEAALVCPACGATRPRICLACHATRLRVLRAGVTSLAADVRGLLPRVEVAVVDAATREVGDAAVLVGTEAVLHRAGPGRRVGLCAFVDIDRELLALRYRAGEQARALLARGARLVGPRGTGGRLLAQTRLPDHDVLVGMRDADPVRMAAGERERRASAGFPPFGGLAELAGAPAAVDVACAALRNPGAGVVVLGPTGHTTTSRALVRAPNIDALCETLASVDLGPARAAGRLRVEVDPLRV